MMNLARWIKIFFLFFMLKSIANFIFHLSKPNQTKPNSKCNLICFYNFDVTLCFYFSSPCFSHLNLNSDYGTSGRMLLVAQFHLSDFLSKIKDLKACNEKRGERFYFSSERKLTPIASTDTDLDLDRETTQQQQQHRVRLKRIATFMSTQNPAVK